MILKLVVTAGIVLFYRWTLHLSSPRADYIQARDVTEKAAVKVRQGVAMIRVWLVSLIGYTPSSQVKDAWKLLRERLEDGRYGTAGT